MEHVSRSRVSRGNDTIVLKPPACIVNKRFGCANIRLKKSRKIRRLWLNCLIRHSCLWRKTIQIFVDMFRIAYWIDNWSIFIDLRRMWGCKYSTFAVRVICKRIWFNTMNMIRDCVSPSVGLWIFHFTPRPRSNGQSVSPEIGRSVVWFWIGVKRWHLSFSCLTLGRKMKHGMALRGNIMCLLNRSPYRSVFFYEYYRIDYLRSWILNFAVPNWLLSCSQTL